MKVLFITMAWPKISEYNLYSDLMEEFSANGNDVTVVTACEKRNNQKTCLIKQNGMDVIYVATGNIQKTNKYMKVFSSFLAGPKILGAIKKYCKNRCFDLILFSTPPITFSPSVIKLKKVYKSKLYLLLKDIWPQDSVDLGAMKKGGLVWRIFRYLEVLTYKNSDYIGCMSPANVEYILKNNGYINQSIVEVCPNSQKNREYKNVNKKDLRRKYSIPLNKIVFVFGGNIGKSQGVEFLIDIAKEFKENKHTYFLIIGSGTEYEYLCSEIYKFGSKNIKIMPSLAKDTYEDLVRACDAGLIMLNPNGNAPNFPSRLLSYLHAGIPVIAAVDTATDLGDIIENNNCGIKCLNGDIDGFKNAVTALLDKETRVTMGKNARELFLNEYTSDRSYEIIMKHFQNGDEL